jgi:hypothetical protein
MILKLWSFGIVARSQCYVFSGLLWELPIENQVLPLQSVPWGCRVLAQLKRQGQSLLSCAHSVSIMGKCLLGRSSSVLAVNCVAALNPGFYLIQSSCVLFWGALMG